MKTNTICAKTPIYTHEGARAAHINPDQQLRRSVLSCLLFEKEFYENGESIADRIRKEAQNVSVDVLANLAIEARLSYNLRHVPLYLVALLAGRARGSTLVSYTLEKVICRADELAEFLAIYAKVNGVVPSALKPVLSNQVRKGLAGAFHKFDEYALAKYDRAGAVRLRDVLFLCHAKPRNSSEEDIWSRLISGKLKTPETWEVALSRGDDKREVFEGLLWHGKLGYLALLLNLRNMQEAGVDRRLVADAILNRIGTEKVLPFRYVAAARAAPQYIPELDRALQEAISELPKLLGMTVVLVDVSGSMEDRLSAKSDMTRQDAAAALASIINVENIRVFTFADYVMEVSPYRGLAGVDAIVKSQTGGTRLFEALDTINNTVLYDRLIVITDEQVFSPTNHILGIPAPKGRGYLINVASNQNGVGYGKWNHIDGFSESVIRWIVELEKYEALELVSFE